MEAARQKIDNNNNGEKQRKDRLKQACNKASSSNQSMLAAPGPFQFSPVQPCCNRLCAFLIRVYIIIDTLRVGSLISGKLLRTEIPAGYRRTAQQRHFDANTRYQPGSDRSALRPGNMHRSI